MKKNDWILAGTVLIAALFFLVGNCFTERRGKDAEKYLRIKVDGEVFREVSLEEDAEITIGEHNRVKIQDGQVEMIWQIVRIRFVLHIRRFQRIVRVLSVFRTR